MEQRFLNYWFIAVAALIAYGSLYPFVFSIPERASWEGLLTLGSVSRRSIGDILGNIGLFLPLGLLGGLAALQAQKRLPALVGIASGGIALAMLLQVLQVFVPSRDPAAADILWNAFGLALGALASSVVVAQDWRPRKGSNALMPAALLIAWATSELIPLVPSIDLEQFKDSLRPLLVHPAASLGDVLLAGAAPLLLGEIIVAICGLRWSTLRLAGLLAAGLCLKILMVKVEVDLSLLIGWSIGIAAWAALMATHRVDRRTAILIYVLLALGIAALEPFEVASTPNKLHLLPFTSLLEGSLLTNVQTLGKKVFLYAGLLWVVLPRALRIMPVAVVVAALAFMLELLQTLLAGRVAAVDEPLLIIALGLLFKQSSVTPGARQVTERTPRPVSKEFGEKVSKPAGSAASITGRHRAFHSIATLVLAAAALGVAMSVVLHTPGLPYNLGELFRGDGNFLFLAVFGLAILWVGIGGYWVGRQAAASRFPGLVLPAVAMMASLVSLALLNVSVTTESLDDITGSNNLYWFVTNRNTWGTWWRELFLLTGPGVVGCFERAVRYAALHGPVAASLGVAAAVWLRTRQKTINFVWAASLGAGLIGWLVLCKLIAFDWSSTDNLNELIARPGKFGLGGGGFLYALVLLIACNAWLPLAVGSKGKGVAATVLGTAVAFPLSWILLNHGLETEIQKYGITFSGVQFMLGPDRQSALSDEALFLRWCFLYLALIGVTATGLRIGYGVFPQQQFPDKPN